MQKIEECDSTVLDKSNESLTKKAAINNTNTNNLKKSVRFGSQIGHLDTESPVDGEIIPLNANNQDAIKNTTSKTTNNSLINSMPIQVKQHRKESARCKYLVCFKSSRNSSESSNTTPPNLRSVPASNDDDFYHTSNKQLGKRNESSDNLQPMAQSAGRYAGGDVDFNNISKERQQASDSFRANVLRMFRQFTVKNRCCCRLVDNTFLIEPFLNIKKDLICEYNLQIFFSIISKKDFYLFFVLELIIIIAIAIMCVLLNKKPVCLGLIYLIYFTFFTCWGQKY